MLKPANHTRVLLLPLSFDSTRPHMITQNRYMHSIGRRVSVMRVKSYLNRRFGEKELIRCPLSVDSGHYFIFSITVVRAMTSHDTLSYRYVPAEVFREMLGWKELHDNHMESKFKHEAMVDDLRPISPPFPEYQAKNILAIFGRPKSQNIQVSMDIRLSSTVIHFRLHAARKYENQARWLQ